MPNNLKPGSNIAIAKVTTPFSSVPAITAQNTASIFLIDGNSIGSYVPGRAINAITGFQVDKGYFFNMLLAADVTAQVIAPGDVLVGGGGGGNTTPAIPTIIADDGANTIDASHALGDGEIMVSTNDAAYVQFNGAPIAVGDVARAAGYYKFKTKAATGRNESPVASSPAFTVAGGGGGAAGILSLFNGAAGSAPIADTGTFLATDAITVDGNGNAKVDVSAANFLTWQGGANSITKVTIGGAPANGTGDWLLRVYHRANADRTISLQYQLSWNDAADATYLYIYKSDPALSGGFATLLDAFPIPNLVGGEVLVAQTTATNAIIYMEGSTQNSFSHGNAATPAGFKNLLLIGNVNVLVSKLEDV